MTNRLETIRSHKGLAACPLVLRRCFAAGAYHAMPVHFAAACSNHFSALTRFRPTRMPLDAANDNGNKIGGDRLLRAALRHFAEHGLSAAERARDNAESAFFAGNRDEYRRWMAICTALDRRMPASVAFRRGASPARWALD